MSRAVANHLRYWLDQFNITHVTISGGEPLLMSDEMWRRVCHALPSGLDGIYIVSRTATSWTSTARSAASCAPSPCCRSCSVTGPTWAWASACRTTSTTRGYDERAWRWFQDAVANPWEWADGDDDPIYGIDAEHVNFSHARHRPHHARHPDRPRAQRIGRRAGHLRGLRHQQLDAAYMGDDDQCAHQLTVYPDGTLKACCNGGPTIGTIYEDGDAVLQRHLDFVLALRKRYGHKPDEADTSVPTTACLLCAKVAREFYPTKEA